MTNYEKVKKTILDNHCEFLYRSGDSECWETPGGRTFSVIRCDGKLIFGKWRSDGVLHGPAIFDDWGSYPKALPQLVSYVANG